MGLNDRAATNLEVLGVGPDEHLGVAVSGGADSVALLHLLADARPVHVLHVDHGLRDESRDDARFVSQLARELGLQCSVLCVDIDAQHADSLEAAARTARYETLERQAARLGLRWVATAHTLDDQAETVLMRAIRGSGVGGLGGIPRVRGIFVRPLLDVSRSELRAWLDARGLVWREDASNADTRFERNWVRHELMPLIERRRPGAGGALARLASLARADDDTLEAFAAEVVDRAQFDESGILLEALNLVPLAIATRAVRQACWRLGENPTYNDVAEMLRRNGARCGSLVAHNGSGTLAIMRNPQRVPDALALDATAESRDWGLRVRVGAATTEPWVWRTRVPESEPLIVRSRRPGDRVVTRSGTKKVSDVLIDAKIPRVLRDFVPIVATGKRPIAVIGLTEWSEESDRVVDAAPASPSWTRAAVWNRA